MEEISTLISQQFTNVGILKIEQVRQCIMRLVNFKTNVPIKRIAAMVKEQKIFMPDSAGCRIAEAGYLRLTKKGKYLSRRRDLKITSARQQKMDLFHRKQILDRLYSSVS